MKGVIMQTYTIAELGRSPKSVCTQEEPVLITNNGKPQNLIFNIKDLPIDQSISLAQELYGRYCIKQIQNDSVARGLDKLTDEEIEAEIQAARANR
jgi:PHD/YefM family antitoxin component YafN of YafNO toxin-antitoxin module